MTAVLTVILAVVDAGLLVWNLRLLRENETLSKLLRHSTAGG